MTNEEVFALRQECVQKADHYLQGCGEYHPNHADVSDVIFAKEIERITIERCAAICDQLNAATVHRLSRADAQDCSEAIRGLM